MNELITQTTQLPDTIEDLTQFVLVGKSKLNAYMLKLRTVNRLSVAQEIRNQTLEETQELANALIAAEQRIGELLLSIPKASGGDRRSEDFKNDSNVNFEKTKSETISDMGYGEREARDYQQMAKNPEIVRKVIEEATANGEVVTKTAVMKQIQQAKAEAREEARQESRATIEQLRRDNRTLANRAAGKTTIVAPEDYEEIKAKADAYDEETQRLNKKLDAVYNEKRQLEDTVRELQTQTVREQSNNDFVAGAIYFIAQCGSFIRDVGGYVWIADKLAELPERDRQGYIKAAMAVRDWATVLLQNIERSECGKQEIERIGVESIKE